MSIVKKITSILNINKNTSDETIGSFFDNNFYKDYHLFKDKVVYGTFKENNKFHWDIRDPSHSLYLGSMGTGSVLCARFNILSQLISNPDTLFIGMDLVKGLSDFENFNQKNHIKMINHHYRSYFNYIHILKNELYLRMNSKNKYSNIIFFLEQSHILVENSHLYISKEIDKQYKEDLSYILKNGIDYGI